MYQRVNNFEGKNIKYDNCIISHILVIVREQIKEISVPI